MTLTPASISHPPGHISSTRQRSRCYCIPASVPYLPPPAPQASRWRGAPPPPLLLLSVLPYSRHSLHPLVLTLKLLIPIHFLRSSSAGQPPRSARRALAYHFHPRFLQSLQGCFYSLHASRCRLIFFFLLFYIRLPLVFCRRVCRFCVFGARILFLWRFEGAGCDASRISLPLCLRIMLELFDWRGMDVEQTRGDVEERDMRARM